MCRYFSKGSLIAINGRIQTRNYQDKSGNNRTAFAVVAENINFGGSKGTNKQVDDGGKRLRRDIGPVSPRRSIPSATILQ